MNNAASKLQQIFTHWIAWVVLGLVIASLTIWGAVHMVLQSMDHSDTLRSPQYTADAISSTRISFNQNTAHTASEGVIKIASDKVPATDAPESEHTQTNVIDDPEKIWQDDKVVTYNSFTEPEKVVQENGSLGVLTIPKLGLSVNIFEADNEIEAMTKGIAHFKHTSSWDGNIGLCGHNVNYNLTDGYFKNLHTLQKGDEVRISSSLGERVYTVATIKEIAETDWNDLNRTNDNRVTMITCISGKPSLRLMVQAVEEK